MSKAEIKEALEKATRQLATAEKMNAPESAIAFAKSKIEKLKAELEKPEEPVVKKAPAVPVKKDKPVKKEPKKTVPVKKASKPEKKKSEPAKAKKEERHIEIDGKKYFEKDKDFCLALIKRWNTRSTAMKKANKKFKTKTISERIGSDIAGAVVKAIEHVVDVKDKQIAANPKLYIAKFERLEESAETFVKSVKDVLGSDYSSSEIKQELEDISSAINKIKSKLKK